MAEGENIKIEMAKSWFTLASIFILLSGFLFASGGIMITNAQNSLQESLRLDTEVLSSSLKIAESNISAELKNASIEVLDTMRKTSDSYKKIANIGIDTYTNFFTVGCAFAIFAFLSWMLGRYNLNKIMNTNKK